MPKYAYENISNTNTKEAHLSAKVSLDQGWTRRGYDPISLDDIPWKLRRSEERSWNFLIHSLDMVDNLLKAYENGNDSAYFDTAYNIAISWCRYNKDTPVENLSPMTWYDMATGLRVLRLAYIFEVALERGLMDKFSQDLLWGTLKKHAEILSNDDFIVFHNNHGYYQVAGQMAMGRRFQHIDDFMAQSYQQGLSRFSLMLDQQFAVDGVHKEHSPDYHRMTADTLKAIIESGLVEDKALIERYKTIEIALSWFITPTGHIANFGDSDHRVMIRKPNEAQRKWFTPNMRYAASLGLVGQRIAHDFNIFKHGGYAIVRRESTDHPNDFLQDSYLAQTACFHSRTHKQADDLSLIWYERGVPLLIDAGRYGYLGKAKMGTELWLDGHWYSDPMRVYIEATCAHNTIEFDGKNNARKRAPMYGSAIKRSLSQNSDIFAVETEIKSHTTIRQTRVWIFKPGKWLLVFDWFHDNLKAPHTVRQWWHTSPDHIVMLTGDSYKVITKEYSVWVHSLVKGVEAGAVILGQMKPKIQGFWSPAERKAEPAAAFHYALRDRFTASFATLFSLSKEAPKQLYSNIAPSGRKAQFSWNDSNGKHRIKMQRPADGDWQIDYNI